MAHLLDYVTQAGSKTVADFPLNELDVACLNELGYLPYQEHLQTQMDWSKFHLLADLASQLADQDRTFDFLVTKERIALLEAVLAAPRFEGLALGHYVNDISQEYEHQFAAMIWDLSAAGHRQVVFRGTDDSLIGWKEDFNMSYQRQIPAQQLALAYLKSYLEAEDGALVVSGHSKGGNLALYASSFLPLDLQERLVGVHIYDAPGLHESVLGSSGYQGLKPKVVAFRPQEAIVGVMLGSDLTYQTVASLGKGMEQHDMSKWQVAEATFVPVDGLSDLSLSLEQTFDDWLATHSSQDLKLFFDTCFDLFFDAGIDSLNDLSSNTNQVLKQLLVTANQLDKDQRDFLLKAVGDLIGLYQKHALERAWQERSAAVTAFLGKWQSGKQ